MSGYARLISWEVWNFMSIKHGKCEFDDSNIINLKGYNDSGKSAMKQALSVLFFNSTPSKQVGFIKDDEDYFRILATFEDGVMIMRDKYSNGQSLYEMYKDGEVIFSTKQPNGALTKVQGVPQPIEEYLGLISYEDTYINSRSCFEKLIGVENTGSENYKMFNTVLKSEEIASASIMLNNDKNSLIADINSVDNNINSLRGILGSGSGLTMEMISFLKEHDSMLDTAITQCDSISKIEEVSKAISDIVVLPELAEIPAGELNSLESISNLLTTINSIPNVPEMSIVDEQQLIDLETLRGITSSLNSLVVPPMVGEVDIEQLNTLEGISTLLSHIAECSAIIIDDEMRIADNAQAVEQLEKQLNELGAKVVRCPDCGCIFDPEENHTH